MASTQPEKPPRPAKGVYPSPEQILRLPDSVGIWEDEMLLHSVLPWRRRKAEKRAAERARTR